MGFFSRFRFADSPDIDASGRLRVSEPHTIFDSKQIFDNQPLFWGEALETGGGISAAHYVDEAATTFTSTINTAGKFTRQTFMRFNYQSGKGQKVTMTVVLDLSGGGTGVERRVGLFDDENGLFFEDNAGVVGVTLRSKVTGSVVDTTVAQTSWNLDKMAGSGPSGLTADFAKGQIFVIDFEWLSLGRVRFGLKIGGKVHYVHQFLSTNEIASAFMSTPNLPLRYQMITTGSSPASTMMCICTDVVSEGGVSDLGVLRYKSTEGAHVDAATNDIVYAVVGIRLKATHVGATVNVVDISIAEHVGSKEFEWMLIFNPTVAGTFTYGDETNSAIQTALGATANTVTGGTIITGGYGSSAQKGGETVAAAVENALRLGVAIDGTTLDTTVLCVRPVAATAGLDVEGSITWRELS